MSNLIINGIKNNFINSMWLLIYFENMWPSLLYFYDFFLLNMCVMYMFFLLYLEYNIFYLTAYFLLEFFFMGMFLLIYQVDMLVAFFWLSELTMVFIFLFFLISLNYTNILNTNNNFIKNFYFMFFVQIFILYFLTLFDSEYFYFFFKTNLLDLWDNYYESIKNNILNDLFVFFLMFYLFNGYEFLLLMLLLLLSTMLCVKFNNFLFQYKLFNESKTMFNFQFLENYYNFFFLRKQNLIKQMFSLIFTQIIFKK